LRQRNGGLIRQVTSLKSFNSYEIFNDWTSWPFNTGDCLIEMSAWAGLTVNILDIIIPYIIYYI
jgi:hypothetical protein